MKKTLLNDSEGEGDKNQDNFNINKSFAEKFEHNKRRQLLEQGKLKYGDLIQDDQEESEESSSSDDSVGQLVNPKFEKKFFEVITAIRVGDPKVLTKTGDNAVGEPIWHSDDFDEDEKPKVQKKDKKFTLKDQIRTDTLKKIEDGVSASDSEASDNQVFKKQGKGPTIAEEQRKLK